MTKKSVNIVAIKDNWILHEIAQKLADGLDYIDWTEAPTGKSRLTYYINYAQARDQRVSEIEASLFTHIEEGSNVLIKKWWQVADDTDVSVCMSKLYADKMKRVKSAVLVIPPGVDLDKFQLKPIKIGVIGSVKKSGRKGEELIAKVMDIPNIEWHFTGGQGWPGQAEYLDSKDLPAFYAKLDYVLVASLYEGGPMSVVESLATGVPVIAPLVGWVPELPHISFKLGDADSLRKVLEQLVAQRTQLRQAVADRTWDNYVQKHDQLFKSLLAIPSGKVSQKTVAKAVKNAS